MHESQPATIKTQHACLVRVAAVGNSLTRSPPWNNNGFLPANVCGSGQQKSVRLHEWLIRSPAALVLPVVLVVSPDSTPGSPDSTPGSTSSTTGTTPSNTPGNTHRSGSW